MVWAGGLRFIVVLEDLVNQDTYTLLGTLRDTRRVLLLRLWTRFFFFFFFLRDRVGASFKKKKIPLRRFLQVIVLLKPNEQK